MIILTDKMLVIPVGISPNYSGVNKPSLEDKSVEITQNGDYSYTASEAYYGIGNFNVKVNVEIPVESEKTVNPSFNEDITVLPSEGFDAMSSVIVKKAVANLEDKNVEINENGDYSYTAGEAYYGIGNFNVKVNVQIPVESEKTVFPSFVEDVTVVPSEGFDAMSSVIVKKAEANLEDKNVQITENGDYSYTTSAPYNGIGNVNVKVNVQEKKIRYAIRPTSGRIICPFTNVLLNETSWVSLDFAMDTSSLSKEKAVLFGISASSLHCYLNNGVLHMYTGEEVPMNKQITLDTNKHTLEFGFVTKADESGHAEFEVFLDGEMIADVMVLVPKFNLPLSLFDVPNAYDGTYDDYIAGGGITHIVNGTGYGASSSAFDLFALTVYDKPGYYRQTLHTYTPSVDANNKPILLDNITGEYQYPASGTYSYAKIDGDTRTEIASASYTMPFTNDFQYFRPSEGAIIPTDIELPALHRITMYVKDIDSFDAGTSQDALNNVKNRVMIGAQPVLVAPFNHIDYEKGLPRLPITDEYTAILGDTSVGLFNVGFEVYSGYTYSIHTEYGGMSQAFASLKGEHTIKFGQRAHNINNIKTFFMFDDNQDECHTIRGIIQPDVITRVNERKMTPLCIFGTYNFVEGTKPDYVNSLGYQEALNQIGYTTGVRYAVKQIDIEEYPINSDDINTKSTLRHRLVTLTDINGVNCLFDPITGTSYYPYNGTLDVYTGPVEPEPPVTPDASILTNTYVKASADAIVPTDIKLPTLHGVKIYVKDIDAFDEGSSDSALDNVKNRVMIGASPDYIAPFNRIDYDKGLSRLPINESTTAALGDSSIGFFHQSVEDGYGGISYSIHSPYGGTAPQVIHSLTGEHIIDFGTKYLDKGNLWIYCDISDTPGINLISIGILSPDSITYANNKKMAPLCIFGTYNYVEGKTPDDVIALGYENALSQIGYKTGVRYAVKQIDIEEYAIKNDDRYGEPIATLHSLVPARDSNGTICLYDTVSNKSYYPFHGTLDII